jgi:hypothetical protein
LFWKKKRDNNIIDFTFETKDKRRAFRVFPPPGFAPIIFRGDNEGDSIPVRDISTGGFSFVKEGFEAGKTYVVTLRLPGEPKDIAAQFEILSIDEAKIRHCRFLDLSEKAVKKIYLYVLEVQKRDLR